MPTDYQAAMSRWDLRNPGTQNPTAVDSRALLGNPGANATEPMSWLDRLLGFTDEDGKQHASLGQFGLNVAGGALNGFLGMKQYGLAKDQFKQNKKEFDMNFGAQRKMTNSRLEDRQRARVSSNPNHFQSVGTYMDKHGI